VPIRVLLVDDVAEVRSMVRMALRFRGRFSVVGEAADGRQAVELSERLQPDVVVLDLGLPDLAGQQVLTRIRECAPNAKVAVFSGTQASDRPEIAERVDGYALKNGELDYLVEMLETLGRRHEDSRSITLACDPRQAHAAREFTRAALRDWGLDELLDDALIVVSELVNNAITHACSESELRLAVGPLALWVEVTDRGSGTPDPLPPSRSRPHGRGLELVDALTASWGVRPAGDGGKLVWAEMLRNPASESSG
jgi:CheY-like chemotaxis protein/anti-sigma regulatory factor (Ser/Thr protein kinase)